jgi:hypothetical protein
MNFDAYIFMVNLNMHIYKFKKLAFKVFKLTTTRVLPSSSSTIMMFDACEM